MSSIIENPAFFNIDDSNPTLRVVKVNQSGIDTEDQENPNESPIFGVNQSDATVDVQIESPKGAITVQVNTGAGDDTIAGAFIADTISAGAGDDLVEGYKGADRLSGGDDDDTLYGDSKAATDNPGGIVKDGNDTIFGGAGNDSIFGGDGDDELYGDDGNDTLFGGAGDDKLFGGAGDDSLDGGDGNDKLFGVAGNDILVGGAGNDSLEGGAGADTLTGGTGADVFRILESDDAVDNITDFTKGEDVIKVIGFGSTDTVTAEDGKVKVNGTEIASFDPTGTLDLTATFNEENDVWEIL